MSKCNLRMRRCFRFQVWECQNASIETWIKAAKFSLKIRIRSEDIDKMQSEFLRSRIFPRSGMHKWGRGGSFEIGHPRSRGWNDFGRSWTRGVGGLENWIIFMHVICVSSLKTHIL